MATTNQYKPLSTVSFKEGFSKAGIQSGLSSIKAALPSAVAVATLPVAASSGILKTAAPSIAAVGKSAISSVGKFIQSNPIKSAVGGLIGIGAVKENPKLLTETPTKISTGLVNVGSNIGQFSKTPSVESALNVYKQNPFIAGGLTAAGLGISAAAVAPLISSASQTSAIREQTAAILGSTGKIDQLKNNIPTSSMVGSGSSEISSTQTPSLSASYPEPTTQLVSYADKKSVSTTRKKIKRKNINTSPITIRNNILIANKNG